MVGSAVLWFPGLVGTAVVWFPGVIVGTLVVLPFVLWFPGLVMGILVVLPFVLWFPGLVMGILVVLPFVGFIVIVPFVGGWTVEELFVGGAAVLLPPCTTETTSEIIKQTLKSRHFKLRFLIVNVISWCGKYRLVVRMVLIFNTCGLSMYCILAISQHVYCRCLYHLTNNPCNFGWKENGTVIFKKIHAEIVDYVLLFWLERNAGNFHTI